MIVSYLLTCWFSASGDFSPILHQAVPLDAASLWLSCPRPLFCPDYFLKFVKTPVCSDETPCVRDMKQHLCVYSVDAIASSVVLTIFSTDEKYVSHKNCVCWRINSITSPPTDCTKPGTYAYNNQSFISSSQSNP